MKKLTFVFFTGLISTHCYPDRVYSPDFNSFDIVTDPRNIAMGESAVADAGNPTAVFSSNPAILASVLRPGIFHGYRSFKWFDDDDLDIDGLYSWSLGMVSATRLGAFGFSFNRMEEGKTSVARFYGQTFFLAYANSYGNIGAGSVLKLFNRYFVGYSDLYSDYLYESTYVPGPRPGFVLPRRGYFEETRRLFHGHGVAKHLAGTFVQVYHPRREVRGKHRPADLPPGRVQVRPRPPCRRRLPSGPVRSYRGVPAISQSCQKIEFRISIV